MIDRPRYEYRGEVYCETCVVEIEEDIDTAEFDDEDYDDSDRFPVLCGTCHTLAFCFSGVDCSDAISWNAGILGEEPVNVTAGVPMLSMTAKLADLVAIFKIPDIGGGIEIRDRLDVELPTIRIDQREVRFGAGNVSAWITWEGEQVLLACKWCRNMDEVKTFEEVVRWHET